MSIDALDRAMLARLGLPPDASRAAIDAARLALLGTALVRARATSPFWRDHPDWPDRPLENLADLAHWPFSTPADLGRADPPFTAVSGGAVERIVTLPTSGTTGPAKRLHFSAVDIDATIDFFRAGMAVFTHPGDRVAIAFPAGRPGGVTDGLGAAMRRLGAEPLFVPGEAEPEGVAEFLCREQPDVVAGPPVRLLAAATVAAAAGRPLAIRAALVSSDHAASTLKRRLARLASCEVFDHWGMTETGFGGGVECDRHDGLHLREADLLIEIVDPSSGRVLGPAEPGEVVVTTLQPRATPLLRYRTGDRARLVTAPCACGSRLSRLVGPITRLDGAIPLTGGAVVDLAAIDEAVFALEGVSDVELRIAPNRGALALAVAAPAPYRNEALRRRVEATVRAMPRIAAALADGRLALDVALAEATWFPVAAKRRPILEGSP